MRYRLASVVVGTAVLCIGIGLLAFRQPPAIGSFPSAFSEVERQDIVTAARKDAVRQALTALTRGQFRLAWSWMVNGRKETVRSVGDQPGGQIHVTFGVDDPAATDGYFIWARYFMKKEAGHWVIVKMF